MGEKNAAKRRFFHPLKVNSPPFRGRGMGVGGFNHQVDVHEAERFASA